MPRKTPSPKPAPVNDAGADVINKYEPVEAPEVIAEPEPVQEPVAETPVPPPAKPAHPTYLTRSAKTLGFDDGEIAEMTTAELKDAINIVNSTRQEDKRVRDVQTSRDEAGRFVKEPPTPEAPFTLKDIGVDPAELGANDETLDMFTKFAKPLYAELKALKAKLADQDSRDQHRANAAALDQLDKLFSTNESVFGIGSRDELDVESPEKLRRNAVIREMAAIPQGQRTTMKRDFERVAKAMFGSLAPAAAPKPAAPPPPEEEEIHDPKGFLNGATTIRPVDRATKPEPKGTRLAEKNLAARMNQRAASAVDTTEFDELPD